MDAVRPAESDGESEVDYSPSPRPVQPKVLRSDQVRHKLDKGPWAATPAVREGWKIYLGVSSSPDFPLSSLLIPPDLGQVDDPRPDLPALLDPRAQLFWPSWKGVRPMST